MISLNHVLSGTAIGLALKQPLLIAPLAFASHFILDALPHYAYGLPDTRRFAVTWFIDAIASATALVIIVLQYPLVAAGVITGSICAELPDVFWFYYYRRKRPRFAWFFRFHRWIQWSETNWGLAVELLYLGAISMLNATLLMQLR